MSATEQTANQGSSQQANPLVTLPHSGLQVPDSSLRVTSLRQLPTFDGVAFRAVLRRDRTQVGTIENEGRGGGTDFHPTARKVFGYAEINAFAEACRTASGEPCSTEHVLNDLVEEYDTGRIVARYARRGGVAVRLMAPIIEGDPQVYGTEFGSVGVPAETAPDPAAIARALDRSRPAGPGEFWQFWTGTAWQTLTAPATSAGGG